MDIVKKIGAAGTAVVASAATLMLGIGPASAARPISLNEVDGVQLLQGGIAAQVVVDVNCAPGHSIVVGVGVTQTVRHSPGTVTADGFGLVTCSVGDNDVRVTVLPSAHPFETGPS